MRNELSKFFVLVDRKPGTEEGGRSSSSHKAARAER
eukprot:COSAG06_NODE_3994_length_4678_cov_23.025551_2_plen_36_part_00